jgi:putative inorganic carbon (hco3(-)) transporter
MIKMLQNLAWISKSKVILLVSLSTLILVGMSIIGYTQQQYWIWAIPVVLFVAYLLVFKLETLLFSIYFFVPISIVSDNSDLGVSFAFPSEPILFGLMLFFFLKLLIEKQFDSDVLKHPIVVLMFAYFAWMGITTLTSSMPLVSAKSMLSHMWGAVTYVLLGSQLFRKYENIHKALWIFVIGFTVVIAYVLVRHADKGFSIADSSIVLTPFMWNHCVYGAVISFMIPYLFLYALNGKKFDSSTKLVPIAAILTFIWLIALFFSYTRAAWLSVIAAIGFSVVTYLRITFKQLLLVIGLGGCIAWFMQDSILRSLESNNKVSNQELSSHLKSISNVKNDESNLERLNRWSSGFNMLKEKPILGWGTGTYMFQYAPFQNPWQKTSASTNFGEVGSIHSEYFGTLVEMGILGFLLFFAMNLAALATGLKLYYESKKNHIRLLALSIILGLITYLVHGLVNNFLDWDKASLLFWSSFGILTSLSVYHNKCHNETQQENQ